MSGRGLLRVMLFSFLVWVFAASLAWAQLPTSTLNGIVTDPQGAAVAGAKVTLTSKATGLTRVTMKLYDDARHELVNEINREVVTADLITWLDEVTTSRT